MDKSKVVWARGLYRIVRREFKANGVKCADFVLMACACVILQSDSYAECKAYAARDNYGYDVLDDAGITIVCK